MLALAGVALHKAKHRTRNCLEKRMFCVGGFEGRDLPIVRGWIVVIRWWGALECYLGLIKLDLNSPVD